MIDHLLVLNEISFEIHQKQMKECAFDQDVMTVIQIKVNKFRSHAKPIRLSYG